MKRCAITEPGWEEGMCLTHLAEYLEIPYATVASRVQQGRYEALPGYKVDCEVRNRVGFIPWGHVITYVPWGKRSVNVDV